ncbi:CASP-like protein 5B3 [Canna indica]|uniref:CASP-like protein n=1 Tax=Canna indica TaxID=4628 RepID=A0AAQ3KLI0_9LILI|nr:CASP-like protein 5B3 [Canna indica]
MKVVVGSPGTWSGLLLRVGQCAFAGASIGVMLSAYGFSNYTAFCYLIASMGLQALWSFGLLCLDIFALKYERDLHNPLLVSLFVVGDWVTATLSLAAACSSAGVTVLFVKDLNFCEKYHQFSCGRFQISIAMAFVTWLLVAKSSLVMFWILASV